METRREIGRKKGETAREETWWRMRWRRAVSCATHTDRHGHTQAHTDTPHGKHTVNTRQAHAYVRMCLCACASFFLHALCFGKHLYKHLYKHLFRPCTHKIIWLSSEHASPPPNHTPSSLPPNKQFTTHLTTLHLQNHFTKRGGMGLRGGLERGSE